MRSCQAVRRGSIRLSCGSGRRGARRAARRRIHCGRATMPALVERPAISDHRRCSSSRSMCRDVTKHNPAGTARGYPLEDFADAFGRYTHQKPSDRSESHVNQDFASDASNRRTQTNRQTKNSHLAGNLMGLTLPDGDSAENEPPHCDRCLAELDPTPGVRRMWRPGREAQQSHPDRHGHHPQPHHRRRD